jgi:hypothetical protein
MGQPKVSWGLWTSGFFIHFFKMFKEASSGNIKFYCASIEICIRNPYSNRYRCPRIVDQSCTGLASNLWKSCYFLEKRCFFFVFQLIFIVISLGQRCLLSKLRQKFYIRYHRCILNHYLHFIQNAYRKYSLIYAVVAEQIWAKLNWNLTSLKRKKLVFSNVKLS